MSKKKDLQPQSGTCSMSSSTSTTLSSTSTPLGTAVALGTAAALATNGMSLGVGGGATDTVAKTLTVATGGPKKSSSRRGELPRLFYYMETGQWDAALERLRRNPREAQIWATLRTKSMTEEGSKVSGTKRLALHHACFKLRSAGGSTGASSSSNIGSSIENAWLTGNGGGDEAQDPFALVCRFILTLIKLFPEAAGQRESRHGCLPLHLAAFASCAPRPLAESHHQASYPYHQNQNEQKQQNANGSGSGGASNNHSAGTAAANAGLARPATLSRRTASDATNNTMDTAHTNMSGVFAEENYTGGMSDRHENEEPLADSPKAAGATAAFTTSCTSQPIKKIMTLDPNVSVAMRSSSTMFSAASAKISARREEMAVHVMNALLDAYPKAVRVDSEGGRLPLHTACAGRATPRVISTLVTAYPSAARHRNKDGFLPLHLAAHWGVSHPDVAITLLKTYPDATVGRNRWERTPLEEALCMAGENGRPHQALLVRALRKHPSYWSRPPSELFRLRNRNSKQTIVDVDESLPSSDSTTLEEQMRHFDLEALMEGIDRQGLGLPPSPGGLMSRLTPRGKGRKEDEDFAVGVKLSTLIQNQKWSSVLARLEINPHEAEEELQEMTRGGFFATTGMAPLHYACERRPPVGVVQALLELYPMAIMTRTMPGGCLPLHVACTWFALPDVVKALLSADPGSAKVKDELGNLALHSACFSGADLEVVEALVGASAGAVLARNHQGSRPIDICKRLRHDNRRRVMALLTLKKEEIMAKHRRSRSSGNLSDLANEAAQLNEQHDYGYDGGIDLNLTEEVGVEVPYANVQEAEELVWI